MQKQVKCTFGEIGNRRVKYVVFKSTGNPKQYYQTTFSSAPWWREWVPKSFRKSAMP